MAIILIIIGITVIDQLSKLIIVNNMSLHQTIPVIENFFHITYVRNPGAAFGILAYRTEFFIIITSLVIVILGYYVYTLKRDQLLLKIAFALQIGGAIGNFVDRIRSGYVVDFIDFKVWSPVFNIADMAIVIGVGLFALEILFEYLKEKKAEV